MGDMISDFRHELLTPVNHIIGYSEILVEDAEASGSASALERLRLIVERGTHVLEEIERVLPKSATATEADLPALRNRLLPALSVIVETCNELQKSERTESIPASAEDLEKIRAAGQIMIELVGRIPDRGVDEAPSATPLKEHPGLGTEGFEDAQDPGRRR